MVRSAVRQNGMALRFAVRQLSQTFVGCKHQQRHQGTRNDLFVDGCLNENAQQCPITDIRR